MGTTKKFGVSIRFHCNPDACAKTGIIETTLSQGDKSAVTSVLACPSGGTGVDPYCEAIWEQLHEGMVFSLRYFFAPDPYFDASYDPSDKHRCNYDDSKKPPQPSGINPDDFKQARKSFGYDISDVKIGPSPAG